MRRLFILIFVTCNLMHSYAQVDRDFWFAPPFVTYFHAPAGNKPLYLRISAMDVPAIVTVEWPALGTKLAPISLLAGGNATVQVDPFFSWIGVTGTITGNQLLTYPPGAPKILGVHEAVVRTGMHITSTADITVYYQNDNANNRDLYSLKGKNALGSEFYVPFQNRFNNILDATYPAAINQSKATYIDNGSEIDIVAAEGDVNIEVILPKSRLGPRVNNVGGNSPDFAGAHAGAIFPDIPGVQATYAAYVTDNKNTGIPASAGNAYGPGDTIRIHFTNAGDSYSVRAKYKTYYNHLGGTIIKAKNNKKIAVTINDDSVIGNCGCWDIIGDQLVPVNVLGSQYIVMSSKLFNCSFAGTYPLEGWAFVTPAIDNDVDTTVLKRYVPLVGIVWDTLVKGSNVAVKIPKDSSYMLLQAFKIHDTVPAKVAVLHVAGFGCEMGGAVLPSIENCTGSTEVSFFRGANRNTEAMFLNLMTRDGAQDSFFVITKWKDTIPIPGSWFQRALNSGGFPGADPKKRGWWILKDAYKRFGNDNPASDILPANHVGFPKGIAAGNPFDGDISNPGPGTYGFKNGIPIYIGDVTKIINTQDFFHLGIYGGGPNSTCQYGYFSSFNSNLGSAETLETLTETSRKCYKDTATLHAKGGLRYEWFYDPTNNGIESNFTKQYLDYGSYTKSVCKVYGFTMPASDSMKKFYFKVKIRRSICFGDTIKPVVISMLPPIFANIGFSTTQLCSGDTIRFTNTSTGANKNEYIWEYHNSYDNEPDVTKWAWHEFTPTPKDKSPFTLNTSLAKDKRLSHFLDSIPYSSNINKTLTVRFKARKEHCEKRIFQDIIMYPGVKADFGTNPKPIKSEKAPLFPLKVMGCNPLAVSFSDSSKGITINQRIWNFGDGSTAFTLNPNHTFINTNPTDDTIKASLTVKSNYCTSKKDTDIVVYHQVLSGFSMDTAVACSPADPTAKIPLRIKSNAKGGNVTWKFHYGNGTRDSKINMGTSFYWNFPVNNNDSVRIDTVIQVVDYINSAKKKLCSDSTRRTVKIYHSVTANFTMSNNIGCSPLKVAFNKPNNKINVSITWDFGDGNTSVDTITNFIHEYSNLTPTIKTFPVKLTVQSANLCRHDTTKYVTVAEQVNAFFNVDTLQGCAPLKVKITNASRAYGNSCSFDIEDYPNTPNMLTTSNATFTHNYTFNTVSVQNRKITLIVKNSQFAAPYYGCLDTMIKTIRIFPLVKANFSASKTSGCQPVSVDYTLQNYNIDIYNWNYGDGTSSVDTNVTKHTFINPSAKDTVYKTKLIVYSNYGCTDTSQQNITVGAYLKADFNPNLSEGCSPLTVKINNSSRLYGAIDKYTWSMVKGVTLVKTDTNTFNYIFTNKSNNDSIHNTKLVVEHKMINNIVCKDSLTQNILVHPQMHPKFTVNTAFGCQPLNVIFTNKCNTSNGKEPKFNWDFGDGVSNTSSDTSHVYTNLGFNDVFRTVKLTAESSDKCVNDTSMVIQVFGYFNIDYKVDRSDVCSGYPFTFTNNSVGSQIDSYTWDFKETGSSRTYTAAAQPATFPFTYLPNNTAGNNLYDVALTGKTKHVISGTTIECSHTLNKLLTVHPKVTPAFGIVDFNSGIASTKSCSPFTAKLLNNSGKENSLSYSWTFFDGTSETNTSPTKIFTNPNGFDITVPIKLIATSVYQCKDSITQDITIYHKPIVKLEVSPSVSCTPLISTFKNNSITNNSTFYWDFNDDTKQTTTSQLPDIQHTFNTTYIQPGADELFKVQLTAVSSPGGCRDSASTNVYVHPRVVVGFGVDTSNCAPYLAYFTNQSEQTAVTFDWDFGDGITSVSKDPQHLYPNAGVYKVTLIGRSVEGCTRTVSKNITVYPMPHADFIATPMLQKFVPSIPHNLVTLENRSTAGSFSYLWNMGDGTTKTDKNPEPYEYTQWGKKANNYKYIIQLIVSNPECADTTKQDIEIRPAEPIAAFDSLTAACPPVLVKFNNTSQYATSFKWNFGDGAADTIINPPFKVTHEYDTSGLYMVTLHAYGEGGYSSTFRNIRIFEAPIANFKLEPLDPMLPKAIIKCMNLSKYADKYYWNFGDNDSLFSEQDPKHQYFRLGTYWVTLKAVTDSGCVDTMMYPKPVIVDGPGNIIFPNAFTPNTNGPSGGKYRASDQTNDVFFPYYDGVVLYHLEIFNRWGEHLFSSDDVTIGWDGYFKGNLCKQDVYVFKCKGTFLNGKSFYKTGDITLLIKE